MSEKLLTDVQRRWNEISANISAAAAAADRNPGEVTLMAVTKTVPPEQTEQDEEILRLIRELGYGKIVITVKNGQPVHAELQKSVLL